MLPLDLATVPLAHKMRARPERLEQSRISPKWASIEIESQCLLGITKKVDGDHQ